MWMRTNHWLSNSHNTGGGKKKSLQYSSLLVTYVLAAQKQFHLLHRHNMPNFLIGNTYFFSYEVWVRSASEMGPDQFKPTKIPSSLNSFRNKVDDTWGAICYQSFGKRSFLVLVHYVSEESLSYVSEESLSCSLCSINMWFPNSVV